jgi:class 3 adenylate cyclase
VFPETRYAKKNGVHVAYQVVGEGDLDLLLVSAWFSHLEARWEIPGFAHYLRRLSSFSRLISFDKHGIGLADPIALDRLPPLEEWMDDVRAVLEATGCQRTAVMGANEGSLMAALFAASYPERVTALVLANPMARPAWAPDHPWGRPPDAAKALVGLIEQSWGKGEVMAALNPSIANDPNALEAWGRFMRLAASPAVAAAVTRMIFDLDIRQILPAISAPTLVVQRRGNPLVPADAGAMSPEGSQAPRSLRFRARTTASLLGMSTLSLTRSRSSSFAGDGLLASFDGPARAVRCAFALRHDLRKLGLEMRAGLHTGEVERRDDRVAGTGVHIASRILSLAEPGEVLVSRTVRDLVAGSGLQFIDRGTHALKGIPDEWRVLAATEAGPISA